MVYPPNPADEAALEALAVVYPQHAAEVRAHEAELDVLWPPWRSGDPKVRRFKHLPYEVLARVKWLLKRRALLMHTEQGTPAPLDWTVRVVPSASGKQCFAHPIMPAASQPAASDCPPSPLQRVHPTEVST
jgi:hypothetical protein